jgi:hypothetical protein
VTNLPDLPKDSALNQLRKAKTPAEKIKAQVALGQYVTTPDFPEAVPAFFTELPFGGNDEELTDRISLNLFTSDEPDKVASEKASTGGRELVGKSITVWDLRAMPGGMGKGWKAYLLMDVTVEDSELHQLVNTGAKQVVARLARAWCEGQIPIKGRIVEIQTSGGGEGKPLAFIAEPDF